MSYQSAAFVQHSKTIKEVPAIGKGAFLPPLLHKLLTAATPYGTEKYIIDLLPFKKDGTVDEAGNFVIKVGDPEKIETMFSCHMDTVHNTSKECQEKKIPGYIWLLTDPENEFGMIYAGLRNINKETGEIKYNPIQLGADDKIGVFTMCAMIEHKIPGLYVFHVGEERGSPGSRYISTKNKELVKGIKRCIAFDRRGYGDIISYQTGGRCCSTKFATALAEGLNKLISLPEKASRDYIFKPDIHGTFTDSANYRELIAECTNVSVGYFNQHSSDEHFDYLWYKSYFLPAVLRLKWDELPTERDPNKKEFTSHYSQNNGSHSYSENYRHAEWINGKWERKKGVNAVEWKDLNKNTPEVLVPDWAPEDGFILETSEEGMVKAVDKWRYQQNHQKLVPAYVDAMLQVKELEADLEDANETIMQGMLEQKRLENEIKQLKDRLRIAHLKPEEFVASLQKKQSLIITMYQYGLDKSIKDSVRKEILFPTYRKYRSIADKLRKRKAVCTPDMYLRLNNIIITMIGIFPDNFEANGWEEFKKECYTFITEHLNEEHFTEFSQEGDDDVSEPIQQIVDAVIEDKHELDDSKELSKLGNTPV